VNWPDPAFKSAAAPASSSFSTAPTIPRVAAWMSKVDELVPPSLAFTSPPRRIHFSTQISNLLSSVQMALFCGSSGGMSIAIARASVL
jgi:hypothetical protein